MCTSKNEFQIITRNSVIFIAITIVNFRNLEVYKALIEVMPKGKYVPETHIQADFWYYPKQQDCIVAVLDQVHYIVN